MEPPFVGADLELGKHIFQLKDEGESKQANQKKFLDTMKQIQFHVSRKATDYQQELQEAIKTLKMEDPVAPTQPVMQKDNEIENRFLFENWKTEKREYEHKIKAYKNFRASLFATVYGQCTPALVSKMEAHAEFDEANSKKDGIALLKIIQTLVHTFDVTRSDEITEGVKMMSTLFHLRQDKTESLIQYKERFEAQVQSMDMMGMIEFPSFFNKVIAKRHGRIIPTTSDKEEAQKQVLASAFLEGANEKYKVYRKELSNSVLNGRNDYPKTITDAFQIMSARSDEPPLVQIPDAHGLAFAQTAQAMTAQAAAAAAAMAAATAVADPAWWADAMCYNCRQIGHISTHCPNPPRSNQGNQSGAAMAQGDGGLSNECVLLDNQSTCSIFGNGRLLQNIRKARGTMTIFTLGGPLVAHQQGVYPGFGLVWYDPRATTNILSFAQVGKDYKIDYNHEGGVFTVDMGEQGLMKFRKAPSGLHYYDASSDEAGDYENGGELEDEPEELENEAAVLVSTVAENKSKYSHEDYLRAETARKVQQLIGRPSTRELIAYVENGSLPNCPVNREDILRAESIFGPDLGSLQGKTVRKRSPKVGEIRQTLPPSILSQYKNVTLYVDVAFVNKIPFLISLSKHIHFGTVEAIPKRQLPHLKQGIEAIDKVYKMRGFKVQFAYMDNEFAPLRGALADLGIGLNETARDEHVPQIERYIRTIKERVRATYNTLPFKQMPPFLVIEMVKAAAYWLNSFPYDKGVSKDLSPRTIITGQSVDFVKHCKYQFGEYVHAHEESNNGMGPRTVGALALRPTGNAQGNWYFMSLLTGRRLNRMHCTQLPMPDDAIEQVHRLARRQKANMGLVFTDRNGMLGLDDLDNEAEAEDEDYYPPDDDDDDDDESYAPESEGCDEEIYAAPESEGYDEEDYAEIGNNEGNDEFPDDGDNESIENTGVEAAEDGANTGVEAAEDGANTGVDTAEDGEDPDAAAQAELEQDMDQRYGARSGAHYLRPRKKPHYTFAVAEVVEENLATPQMSMRQGIKMFGDSGVQAVKKELKQLHDRSVIKARPKKSLTTEQRQRALSYLMFLKRKRCGAIKGRGCADGRPQRKYTLKIDATSPTVTTEAVFLTALIDADQGRDVAIVDIPGAFMQVDSDEETFLLITGKMAELLVEIDPEMYGPYIEYNTRGEMMLYVEMLKALYGTMRAARLFWERLSAQLKEWGFEANPYDPCVVNKMIDGKQCTIAWHVDDLKISHVDSKVVDSVIDDIEKEFGKETPLSKSRGKIHDYLGMLLDFSIENELTVNMVAYVKMVLANIPADMKGKADSPAATWLYHLNENPELLDKETAETFHSMTMQLQYLAQRGRPDILEAVSFLSTRVQAPDKDDYKKLARVMKYLQATVDLMLRLSVSEGGIVHWWVDASYAVHPDMKGHTGATMSMGKGSVYSSARKQKIPTRSSTECELVGVHDVMPQIEWTQMFLDAQGYKVKNTVLYQDNLSTMLLEKNGKMSSGKRTKHINIRYFYVKDKVDSGELRIEHCPTKEMLADFFTKPLQGALFRKLRDKIMNIAPDSIYHSEHRSVLEKTKRCKDKVADVATGTELTDGSTDGSGTGRVLETSGRDELEEGWIRVERKKPRPTMSSLLGK